MVFSRITRVWDRAVLVATTLWILLGVTIVVTPSSAQTGAASQTTQLGGFFLVLSVMFAPLCLYSVCLLVDTLSRRR